MRFFHRKPKPGATRDNSPDTGSTKSHSASCNLFRKQRDKTKEQAPEHLVVEATRVVKDKPLSLWDQAYNALAANNSKMIEKYEKLLSTQLPDESK